MNLEKIRVYQLARDLDTNSKRLMEKLAEIGVVVKNHMSLLEDNELDALYKHIGIKPAARVTPAGGTPAGVAPAGATPAGGSSTGVKSADGLAPADGSPVAGASAVIPAAAGAAAGVGTSAAVPAATGTPAGVTPAGGTPASAPAEKSAAPAAGTSGRQAAAGKSAAAQTGTEPAAGRQARAKGPGRDADKKPAKDGKKDAAATSTAPAAPGRDAKNAPRIIRTTEINLDRAAREERRDNFRQQPAQAGGRQDAQQPRGEGSRRSRGGRGRRRGGADRGYDRGGDHPRATESNTGLIAGLTRMTREESMKQLLAEARAQQKRNAIAAAEAEAIAAKKAAEDAVLAAAKAEAEAKAALEAGVTAAEAAETGKPAADGQEDNVKIATPAAAVSAPDATAAPAAAAGESPAASTDTAAGQPGATATAATTAAEPRAAARSDERQVGSKADERQAGSRADVAQHHQPAARSGERQPASGAAQTATDRALASGAAARVAQPAQRGDRGRQQDGRASFDGRPYAATGSATGVRQGTDSGSGVRQGQRRDGGSQQGGARSDYSGSGRPRTGASFDGRPYQQGQGQGQGGGPRRADGTRPDYSGRPRTGASFDGRPYQQGQDGGGFRRSDGSRPDSAGRPFGQRDGRPGGAGGGMSSGRPAGTSYAGGRPAGPGQRQRSPDFQRTDTAGKTGETGPARSEQKREFSRKDAAKEVKKDMRRDSAKPVAATTANDRNRRFRPQVSIIGEKKGVHEFTDEFIISEFYDTSGDGAKRSRRRQRKPLRREKYIPPRAVLTSVTIPESLTVKELAEALKKTAGDVIKKLIGMGMAASINEVVDFDTATLVAGEFGIATEKEVVVNEEDILFDDAEAVEDELVTRPPVVVVMGHVDHGKTSLLDSIRKTNVIAGEAGGITQHIGAYMVNINGRAITFLDTPGHEAFTSMRARGAMVTDIAILVISAVDGVMPQTVEAINHAKAANVSIIVAINMFDREGANNPERVKQELTEHGLVVEEWGGDVIAVEVSAKTGENVGQLLEMVLLTADVLELKASTNQQAKGTVIEAKLDRNRGPVATLLVQRGVLRVGDSFITGSTVGRIRAMLDSGGENIREAGPSTPVEIIGLSEVPEAGEVFYVTTDDRVTKSLAEKRRQLHREEQLRSSARVTLDDLFSQIQEGKVKELNLIIKADVQGSAEAVRNSLEKLGTDEVRVNIIHTGVGAINESDVSLAGVSNAIIIGFNVRPGGASVIEAAEAAGVDIRLYSVIYNAIEDIQAALKGMLDPTFREVVLGHVEIRQIFKASGVGTIGGCYVLDGRIQRGNTIRLIRDGVVVYDGRLASLRRFKDDAREVLQGFECGISIERFNDIKENDVIEPYMMEEVPVE